MNRNSFQDLHTVDLEEFRHGGTNITAFRLVDPEKPEIQKVIQDWIYGEKRYNRELDMGQNSNKVRPPPPVSSRGRPIGVTPQRLDDPRRYYISQLFLSRACPGIYRTKSQSSRGNINANKYMARDVRRRATARRYVYLQMQRSFPRRNMFPFLKRPRVSRNNTVISHSSRKPRLTAASILPSLLPVLSLARRTLRESKLFDVAENNGASLT